VYRRFVRYATGINIRAFVVVDPPVAVARAACGSYDAARKFEKVPTETLRTRRRHAKFPLAVFLRERVPDHMTAGCQRYARETTAVKTPRPLLSTEFRRFQYRTTTVAAQ